MAKITQAARDRRTAKRRAAVGSLLETPEARRAREEPPTRGVEEVWSEGPPPGSAPKSEIARGADGLPAADPIVETAAPAEWPEPGPTVLGSTGRPDPPGDPDDDQGGDDQELDEGEGEQPEIADLLAALPRNLGQRYHLIRKNPQEWNGVPVGGYCQELIGSISLQTLAAKWGGGDFSIRITGKKGQYRDNRVFALPGPPLLNGEPPTRTPRGSQAERSPEAGSTDRLSRLEGLVEKMLLAKAAPAAGTDLSGMLTLIEKTRSLFGPPDPGKQFENLSSSLEKMLDIAERFNPDAKKNPWVEGAREVIMPLVDSFKKQNDDIRRRIAASRGEAPTPEGPPRPDPYREPTVADPPPPVSSPPPSSASKLEGLVGFISAGLIRAVEFDFPIEVWSNFAETFLDDKAIAFVEHQSIEGLEVLIEPFVLRYPALTTDKARAYTRRVLEQLKSMTRSLREDSEEPEAPELPVVVDAGPIVPEKTPAA